MLKRKNRPSRNIPKAKRLKRSRLTRVDVTRGEYNRIIDILNERNEILNGLRAAVNELREAVTGLEHASEIQFKRIAQLQADFDRLKALA